MSVVFSVFVNNTVDCFHDSPVVNVHIETVEAVVAVMIKHLTVNKVHSVNFRYKMTIIVVEQIFRHVLLFPGSYPVNV